METVGSGVKLPPFFVTELNMCRILAVAPEIAVAVSIRMDLKSLFRYKKMHGENFSPCKRFV
ncbi:MAG TPA: hypothetical protein DG942_00690 [Ruminococcaceae bacterium]|jgi:hypothetical protein|nr:hypothetical protein [Oscillospiraceae bacterium]